MRLFEKEKEELTVRRLFAVLQLFCTVTLIACVARKKNDECRRMLCLDGSALRAVAV